MDQFSPSSLFIVEDELPRLTPEQRKVLFYGFVYRATRLLATKKDDDFSTYNLFIKVLQQSGNCDISVSEDEDRALYTQVGFAAEQEAQLLSYIMNAKKTTQTPPDNLEKAMEKDFETSNNVDWDSVFNTKPEQEDSIWN